MNTVYTVSTLPTVANAVTSTISVVPGFPTDSAKATGGNFTPFAVFFANATTMYVSDEGSGNATDVASHAGLEKWSLVNGVWQLDYVLTKGLDRHGRRQRDRCRWPVAGGNHGRSPQLDGRRQWRPSNVVGHDLHVQRFRRTTVPIRTRWSRSLTNSRPWR